MKAKKKVVRVLKFKGKKAGKPTVTIPNEEYEGLKETIDLLSRPANARRLRPALEQAKAGNLKEREL